MRHSLRAALDSFPRVVANDREFRLRDETWSVRRGSRRIGTPDPVTGRQYPASSFPGRPYRLRIGVRLLGDDVCKGFALPAISWANG